MVNCVLVALGGLVIQRAIDFVSTRQRNVGDLVVAWLFSVYSIVTLVPILYMSPLRTSIWDRSLSNENVFLRNYFSVGLGYFLWGRLCGDCVCKKSNHGCFSTRL